MTIAFRITRDSVCMGDDVDAPHELVLEVSAGDPEAMLREVIRRYPLASIAGGKATWICEVGGAEVAVVAQQWTEPRFIALPLEICDGAEIHFVYHAQRQPEPFLKYRSR
ncbi:MAG: hypothetical protein JWO82_2820 [Akkermansiaceae bacterium]|nr:hypothetical protein [Akkermansiaceae bacterium]